MGEQELGTSGAFGEISFGRLRSVKNIKTSVTHKKRGEKQTEDYNSRKGSRREGLKRFTYKGLVEG